MIGYAIRLMVLTLLPHHYPPKMPLPCRVLNLKSTSNTKDIVMRQQGRGDVGTNSRIGNIKLSSLSHILFGQGIYHALAVVPSKKPQRLQRYCGHSG